MDFFAVVLFFLIPFLMFCLCGFCCRSKQRGVIFSTSTFPWGLIVFIFLIILFSACTHACKNERGAIYRTPVVVTSATHTAPGVYPPSVQNVTVYPTAQSGYQQSPYPQQAPYPVSGVPTAMPMPMPQTHMQVNPMSAQNQMMPPYPPAGGFTMNPPSYESAVGPNQPGYEKQAPYNPGYTTGY